MSKTASIECVLYYANWCGHCVHFKPAWISLKQKMDKLNHMNGGVKIVMKEQEASETKTLPKINDVEIEGYPTIKVTLTFGKTKKECEYTGKRTEKDLEKYIKFISDKLQEKI